MRFQAHPGFIAFHPFSMRQSSTEARLSIHIVNKRSGGVVAYAVRFVIAATIVVITATIMAAAIAYVYLAIDLPLIPPFEEVHIGGVVTVRAAQGQVLAESYEQRRYPLPRERIPKMLINAFMASEDARFFEHRGLDILGIVRAIWSNLRAGEIREGASTITQQLARSLLLSREKSLKRKVREAILARRIEDIYTKDQILTLYLNLIFLGEGAYGVQAAARTYFGKDVSELTIAEAATIAALPQSPGKVNPVRDPIETRARRDRVIRRMREAGLISAAQEAEALTTPLVTVPPQDNLGDRAPYAAIAALESSGLPKSDNLLSNGSITMELAIDLGTQLLAQQAVTDAARALDRRQGYRGPLAKIPQELFDEFSRRNRAWLDAHGLTGIPPIGRMVLAVVTAVDRDSVSIVVAPDVQGKILLQAMSWAAPYTEFQTREGGGRIEGPVSFDGRVKDATRVLSPGDIILVERARQVISQREKRASSPQLPSTDPEELLFTLAQVPQVQAALIAADPRQGYIVALAGGTDFDLSQFDRTQAKRQTGSVIKPIYYSKAFDIGIPPSTVVSGAPFRESNWAPQGDKATDDMTIYQALTQSENNCSLRVFRMVLERVGLEKLNEWAARLGMGRPFSGYIAEALGVDATPAEILRAYSTFSTKGMRTEPVLIKRIYDENGQTLLDNRSSRDPGVPILDAVVRELASPMTRAITTETAWIIAHNLRSVAEEGTAKAAKQLSRPVYGKTGTLPFDVWFAGWTYELVAVVWVGEDLRERYLGRSKESGGVFGASAALPAWMSFIRSATSNRPVFDDLSQVPEGVVIVRVDPSTGLLANEKGLLIPHMKGTEPRDYVNDDWHIEEEVAEF